jgi:UDP:flavonoid glycosyltransferase YjiC (YdhE family)
VKRGRFLFAMWEGGGTAPPELAVASRLASRGHAVTVIGDPTLEGEAASAGARFVSWREAPHRSTRTAETEIVRDWDALTPLGAFARARDRHAFKPAHLFAREVRALLDAEPADVVCCDAMLFGAMAGAESSGARVAALLPMTSFLPGPGRPPAAMGLRPARGPFERLRDRALYAAGDALLWRTCIGYMNDARREVGLGPIAHPLDQLRRTDRVLVQTSAWFDFDAHDYDNVRWVGPELADPAWAGDAPEIGSGDRLVLVALSTTFMDQAPLLEKIIRALAPLPVRAIVTTGPALDPKSFAPPRNVTVCASAPHSAILPRAALVVTHGGHGTVIRALAHGVPILCLPSGRDQSDNAVRIEVIGAGIAISKHSRIGAIQRAIARAIADPELRENAARASQKIRERKGDLAIEELEALVDA